MRYTFKPKRQFKLKLTNRLRITLTIFLSCLFVISGYLIAINTFSFIQHEYFNETTEDGVNIRVVGGIGAIQDGTHLSITKVSNEDKNNISNSINQVKEAKNNVVESYSYDIKILNENNEEIEPSSDIKLIFSYDKIRNNNLDTNIYHTKNIDNELKTEVLPGTIIDNTITTETDSFSYYTVEFTYDNLTYSIPGDSETKLSEVLENIGLSGNVSGVSGSNDSLFSFENRDGQWYVIAHQAFDTNEWMKVTIDGVDYDIVVTDALIGSAYAVLDNNGNMTIFRSSYNYSNNTTGTFSDLDGYSYSGEIFTGFESITGGTAPPWNSSYRLDVKTVVIKDSIAPKTTYRMFDMKNLETITGLEKIDMSNVTYSPDMFNSCEKLKKIVGLNFANSPIINYNNMFSGCKSLEQLEFTNMNASEVTAMGHMFADCEKLHSIDLSGADFRKVVYADSVFEGCTNLESINLTGVRYRDAKTITKMFLNCTSLKSLDLSGFSMLNIVNDPSDEWINGYLETFDGCDNLKSITLSDTFLFKGNGITEDRYKAILPTPSTQTGRWIKTDGSLAKTSEELRDNYDANRYNWKGTWVWELTLTYDANGGINAPGNQTSPYLISTYISKNIPTREGNTFKEWNTAEDGSGISFQNGENITLEDDTPLYAQWKVNKCDLTISEEVRGNIANVNKNFAFTLNLTSGGSGINDTIAYTGTRSGNLTFVNGNATFNLKHGENIILNLPAGYSYTITQDSDGYTLSKTNDSGTLNSNTTSTFTDTLSSTTPTGMIFNFIPYIVLLISSIFGIVWIKKFKKI